MYSTASSMPTTTSMNGIGTMVDGSGTINPAALNTSGNPLPPSSSLHPQQDLRGQKRNRSPDHDDGEVGAEDDEQKAKKRGRPSGGGLVNETLLRIPKTEPDNSQPFQATQQPPQLLPQDPNSSPTQTSPTKPTTTKQPVIKALPTVRDHTTDQLTPEGDEFIPREYDPDGEKKVTATGHPLDGRDYKMRTFYVPNRGEKLFMLATECARVLGYRDSYLLFNKNRSLHKIIATQAEKDELIHQEILPYSYRSRQIAIVTAKSMFRQFGARVIHNGRRVRDDYWEAKARKQGFTEEDMAGDKRPGTGKARDAAALEAAHHDQSGAIANQDINYRDVQLPPDLGSALPSVNPNTPIPMIQTDIGREYGSIPRVRQDISGTPYQDRTQSTSAADILHQASNAAELNKNFTQQRNYRAKNYRDSWNRKIDPPVPATQQKVDQSPTINQSPHMTSHPAMNQSPQSSMLHHQGGSQMVSPQRYQQPQQQPQQQQQQVHNQSPVRQNMPPSMRPDIHHPQRSSVYNPGQHGAQQTTSYGGYSQPPAHLWGPPPPNPQSGGQPHQSPVTSQQSSLGQHYSPSPHQQQLQQPAQSPHHHSPHTPSQLHHSSSHSNIYGSMGGMPSGNALYGGLGQQRTAYNPQAAPRHSGSPNPPQQAYMQQTTATQQAGMQGWAPPPPMSTSGSGWGGYPASTGF